MVHFLSTDRVAFPNPAEAEEDGLLAIGGKLTPEWLLLAYSHGIFPWYDYRNDPICWYCPRERFVIFPREIHISHSLRQMIRSDKYLVSCNVAFDAVIEHCSTAQGRMNQEGAWLGEKMIAAYKKMHELGYGVSVEVWDAKLVGGTDDQHRIEAQSGIDGSVMAFNPQALVGGLYGINIGNNFMGESMFSLVPGASKLALVYLAELVGKIGGIIDCQLHTPHLESMGGRYISYDEYMMYFE